MLVRCRCCKWMSVAGLRRPGHLRFHVARICSSAVSGHYSSGSVGLVSALGGISGAAQGSSGRQVGWKWRCPCSHAGAVRFLPRFLAGILSCERWSQPAFSMPAWHNAPPSCRRPCVVQCGLCVHMVHWNPLAVTLSRLPGHPPCSPPPATAGRQYMCVCVLRRCGLSQTASV